ncbi:Uu.00g103960.m01.CDS01 [Anthostomella pinea]|uniref:Uu.00g103960.m01.CDS01 n=1 Tax=Anthostomella pinea TaxID=933095 RepID=A0AAI8VDL5_9PEZI|nr:Uu.00g103960.m01.CDS01 [Anthostomella pinea]
MALDASISYAVSAGYILLAYVIIVTSYRLPMHPLRDYPGPILANLTDLYGTFYAFGYRLHLKTWEGHGRYDIYQNEMVTKSHAYLATLYTPTSFFAFNPIDKNMHRSKRRIVIQALTDRAMREFEPIMTQEVQTFLRQLLKSGPIDMTEKCKRLALDIAGLLAYGHPLKLQTEETNRFMTSPLQARDFRVNLYLQFQLITQLGIQLLVELPFFRTQRRWLNLVRPLIYARIAEDRRAKVDLYSFAYDTLNEEGRKSNELWGEAFFFLMAGLC